MPSRVKAIAIILAAVAIAPACERRCGEIRSRFRATLAERTDACTTDADCACYSPVGGPELGCGGVTDAKTASRLAAIEKEFHGAGCEWTHQCGPQACQPKCVAGRCGG